MKLEENNFTLKEMISFLLDIKYFSAQFRYRLIFGVFLPFYFYFL